MNICELRKYFILESRNLPCGVFVYSSLDRIAWQKTDLVTTRLLEAACENICVSKTFIIQWKAVRDQILQDNVDVKPETCPILVSL